MGYGIVFIDDRDDLLNGFREAIVYEDVQLIRVATGEDGSRVARDMKPDAIVLSADIANGFATCRTLKKDIDLTGVPLILISRETDESTFEKHSSLPTRADSYLLGEDVNGNSLATLMEETSIALKAERSSSLPLLPHCPMSLQPHPKFRKTRRKRKQSPDEEMAPLEALRQAIAALGASEARGRAQPHAERRTRRARAATGTIGSKNQTRQTRTPTRPRRSCLSLYSL